MPKKENAPPFSNRRARDWKAGAFAISANKWLAAVWTELCAKRTECRSRRQARQTGIKHEKLLIKRILKNHIKKR
jgi:hypothetical protein